MALPRKAPATGNAGAPASASLPRLDPPSLKDGKHRLGFVGPRLRRCPSCLSPQPGGSGCAGAELSSAR
jgi:hypothetical protein